MSRKLNVTEVSQAELFHIAEQRGAIRGGATVDPDDRAGQYFRQGYRGEMYVARTENMMKSEDKLLALKKFRYNVQDWSNVPEEPGYIYVIVGQKRN